MNRILYFFISAILLSPFAGFSQTNTNSVAGPNPPPLIEPQPKDSLTFGLDEIPALQTMVLGAPLSKYLASLLFISLAFISSKVVDSLIQGRL
jgi:hypothetical protein